MANFLLKFQSYAWQQGLSKQSLTDTIKLADGENPYCVQASGSVQRRLHINHCIDVKNINLQMKTLKKQHKPVRNYRFGRPNTFYTKKTLKHA